MSGNVDLFGEPILDAKRNMRDFFIVPPFSVLNTMEEGWQNRKRRWLTITGDLTATKSAVLSGTAGEYGVDTKSVMAKMESSSNFDPVLAEIIYKWFNIEGGKVLDPFGGEQTKGVVCGELGYPYFGNEFRQEQVDWNNKCCEDYAHVKYFCGDSNNIDTIIQERNFDFVFTSPPYYDLEVYSKDDMSALGTYAEFMLQYKNIFAKCFEMMNNNRFLVVKICEIRDKKTGEYRNFVGDNIQLFKDIGFKYYNEIILLNSVGTLPLRAGKFMNASRKVGKRHQNLLVFYKGDLTKIKEQFADLIPKNEYYE